MRLFGYSLAARVLFVLSMAATPVLAQTDEKPEQVLVGNWNLTCETGLCQAFFGIQHPTEDWQLLRWSLLYDGKSGVYSTILRSPTGVALQPGLRIWTGTKEYIDLAFQVCDPLGCEAIALVDQDFRAKLDTPDQKVTISFIPYGEQDPTAFEVSIEGFEEALRQLPDLR